MKTGTNIFIEQDRKTKSFLKKVSTTLVEFFE